jgi:hypothetical protein
MYNILSIGRACDALFFIKTKNTPNKPKGHGSWGKQFLQNTMPPIPFYTAGINCAKRLWTAMGPWKGGLVKSFYPIGRLLGTTTCSVIERVAQIRRIPPMLLGICCGLKSSRPEGTRGCFLFFRIFRILSCGQID